MLVWGLTRGWGGDLKSLDLDVFAGLGETCDDCDVGDVLIVIEVVGDTEISSACEGGQCGLLIVA